MLFRSFACLSTVSGVASLTGDAARDFTDPSIDPISGKPKNFGVVRVPDGQSQSGNSNPDVGVPQQLPAGTISGWDIKAIFFQYDDIEDELLIGVDCFGVCGDADGDGREGVASAELAALGGQDLPGLAQGEGIALVLDFDLNVADVLPSFLPNLLVPFDFVIGVPAGQPADSAANPMPGQVAYLPCSRGKTGNQVLNQANCFGVYDYQDTTAVNIAQRFLGPATLAATGEQWVVGGANPLVRDINPNPSLARPDIEWVIEKVTELRELKGATFTRSNKEPWTVLMQAFAGSFLDAGVGEDYLPSQTDYIEISFPCLELDACDVCLGNGDTCLDCAGVPNGPNVYDACDVCGGDGSTCWDCARVSNGAGSYDICDVCNGDGTSCLDCLGQPNGPAVYDRCDVCDGQDNTCFDCAGIVNGPTTYDVCDVCGGDGSTCDDCLGVPNGPNVYDRCDVCAGDDSTCLDCAGTPNGAAVYDMCDICNGNNDMCGDCLGVPNGPAVYDICNVCGGDGSSCFDCAQVPLGTCEYDACDVCCGDGTTCLDCADVPFGTCKYDSCGVCCGDGSSCVCLTIHKCPTTEVDHALLEWTLIATQDKIESTIDILEAIKEELCRYDVNRGNLASDIASYLEVSNSFRDILDNFIYVSLYFKDSLDEVWDTLPDN